MLGLPCRAVTCAVVHASPVPSPSPVFVGRDQELARCTQQLERIGVVLVCGMGGIGKSALAYAVAARWQHPTIHGAVGAESLATAVNAARRQLSSEPIGELPSDEDRIYDLARLLDETRALWVLDDLHRLSTADRRLLLDVLGRSLRRGRVIATSREKLARGAGDPDRMEIHLLGLDEPAARALWQSLDELYGPADGFEQAWKRSRGSPFQLRRAHAGGFDDDEPLSSAIRALSSDERRLAAALAVSGVRLPVAAVQRLLPPPRRAQAVLRRLVTLLIADVDGKGTCGMHDLFRDAVLDEIDDDLERDVREQLAVALVDAALDPVSRVREVSRHLCALGRYADSGDAVVASAPELVRAGHTTDVMQWIEAIPADERTAPVRLVHARCMAHAHDVRGAYEQLRRFAAHEQSHEVRLVLGEVATIRGELAVGEAALRGLIDDGDAPESVRLQAQILYSFNIVMQGRGDEGRRLMREAEAATDDPIGAAHLAFSQARTLWLEERDAEAEEPMRRSRVLLDDESPLPYEASVLVPAGSASILARLGRFEESDELLAAAERVATRQLDPSSQLYYQRMRAGIAWERGDRVGALEILQAVADGYARAGSISELLVRPWIGRALLALGRRGEALRVLQSAAERADRAGLGVVAGAIEATRAWDPIEQIRDGLAGRELGPKRGEVARARAVQALRAAAAGDTRRARDLVDANAGASSGPGYALDRVMERLALATAARVDHRADDAAAELENAARIAADRGVDPELVPAIVDCVGRIGVVLDGRSHELRARGSVIALSKRPVLRRLLYSLAERPNQTGDKEHIVGAVWSADYDPLRHDNLLWVNIRRLRVLLEPTGLAIDADDGGYCLRVPDGFAYIEAPP